MERSRAPKGQHLNKQIIVSLRTLLLFFSGWLCNPPLQQVSEDDVEGDFPATDSTDYLAALASK